MKITTQLADRANYGGARIGGSIKWIVIHYTGNDGDSARANAKFFEGVRKASAHYFVDDEHIYQSVPDLITAWSIGGAKYRDCAKTGGGKYYGQCKNVNSISIELCDTIRDGKIYPTEKTIHNAIELVEYLMKKYKIPKEHVIRHFDVTGKSCPAYWTDNAKWKSEFWNRIKEIPVGANPYQEPGSVLKEGARGEGVKWLQYELVQEGQKITIDGIFGRNTLKAVKCVQEKHGLIIDGIVGPATRNALK